jgi:hypothetical protein
MVKSLKEYPLHSQIFATFNFFTSILIIHFVKKNKIMKKSNIYLNYIM